MLAKQFSQLLRCSSKFRRFHTTMTRKNRKNTIYYTYIIIHINTLTEKSKSTNYCTLIHVQIKITNDTVKIRIVHINRHMQFLLCLTLNFHWRFVWVIKTKSYIPGRSFDRGISVCHFLNNIQFSFFNIHTVIMGKSIVLVFHISMQCKMCVRHIVWK